MRPDRHASTTVAASFLEEDSNGWLVTFSDLVLQLFAFVLVAAALTPPGSTQRSTSVTIPVARPLTVAATSAPVTFTMPDPGTLDEPDALSLARFDDLPPPTPANAIPVAVVPAPLAVAESGALLTNEPAVAVAAPEPAAVELPGATSLAGELDAYVRAEGLEDVVQVAVNGGGVTLSISDTIGFASGRAELLLDAAPVLAEVRDLVAARPDLVVEVAGHTDDRPVHGGAFHSNLDLSLARAARVAHQLAAGEPELATRVFAAGYGAQRPLGSNDDAEGRARNRRVELRLVPGR
ncbi:MAG: flagellar motor protein MotB [Candidatus Binatia bacterium]